MARAKEEATSQHGEYGAALGVEKKQGFRWSDLMTTVLEPSHNGTYQLRSGQPIAPSRITERQPPSRSHL